LKKYFSLILVFTLIQAAETQHYLPRLKSSTVLSSPEPAHLIGLMVEFQDESDDPDSILTTGNGHFLTGSDTDYQSRCDGFFVDPPPHNTAYFSDQLTAVANYYEMVSDGALSFTSSMVPGIYQVNGHMAEYAQSDTALGRLFAESVELARDEIEPLYSENSLIVIFHAGIGQDFTMPFLDPTPLDLSSAYIDPEMLAEQPPLFINGYEVNRGILLPETQNHIYYDVIEEIFAGQSDYCDYQLGMTGTFAFLMGYALGLPPLFVTEDGPPGVRQGDSGVGVFGLMDQGSNNGRGVIPALPTAWSRTLKDWAVPVRVPEPADIDVTTQLVFRIDIADSEYFLIENRNNFIDADMNIDDYRYSDAYQISNDVPGHYFDVLLDVLGDSRVFVDPETQVILGFDSYDYGYPGSGLLIWHITEPDPDSLFFGINNDRLNRAIQLEEADGAVDIGFPTTALFADPSSGWSWDMWYANNEAYFFANPAEEIENPNRLLRFANLTNPNTRSHAGAESLISLDDIGSAGDDVHFRFNRSGDIPIVELGSGNITVVGSGYSDDDSTATIYYLKEGQLFGKSATTLDSMITDNELIRVLSNPACGDTIIVAAEQVETIWLDDDCERIDETLSPNGVIVPRGMINSLNEIVFAGGPAQALGDVDGDGLDEIAYFQSGDLYVMNGNNTFVDGFPLYGSFMGTPLIADIQGDEHPEIICREDNQLVIIDHTGTIVRSIASVDKNAELRLVPFWDGQYTALIDGTRLLLFPLNFPRCYWLEYHGNSSNSAIVLGEHVNNSAQISGIDPKRTYNYPNPVTGLTTVFRFFTGSDVQRVDILIYDAAGFKIAELKNTNITQNEYNEIRWNVQALEAGVYLAEVRPDRGESKLVKVAIIH